MAKDSASLKYIRKPLIRSRVSYFFPLADLINYLCLQTLSTDMPGTDKSVKSSEYSGDSKSASTASTAVRVNISPEPERKLMTTSSDAFKEKKRQNKAKKAEADRQSAQK